VSPAEVSAVVLGVGNVLLGDDGVGVHVARVLEAEGGLPEGTRVLDGGTLGLDLLPMLDGARSVVIIDALDSGAPPGTVTVLHGDEVGAVLAGALSAHQVGVADLLAAARLTGRLPAHLALVGVQPAAIEVRLDLTAALRDAVPTVIASVRQELEEAREAA
jgi:hydrogenase maturation protease